MESRLIKYLCSIEKEMTMRSFGAAKLELRKKKPSLYINNEIVET